MRHIRILYSTDSMMQTSYLSKKRMDFMPLLHNVSHLFTPSCPRRWSPTVKIDPQILVLLIKVLKTFVTSSILTSKTQSRMNCQMQ